MKLKKIIFGIVITGLLIIGAGILFKQCIKSQKEKLENLRSHISELKKEIVPIKFDIEDKTNKKITVEVRFYNTSEELLAKEHFTLIGNELTFDFQMVMFNNHYIGFPWKLYTDIMPPDSGKLLQQYYTKEGFPAIYKSQTSNDNIEEGIQVLYEKLMQEKTDSLPGNFGSAVHDLHRVREFLPHHTYKIVLRTKGGIEIIPE